MVNKKKYGGLTLCTDCYSVQDVVKLLNVLVIRYGLVCSLHQHNEEGQYRIYIHKKSLRLLDSIVRSYMDISMLYKISSESRSIDSIKYSHNERFKSISTQRYYSTFINKSNNNFNSTCETFTLKDKISRPYKDKFSGYLAGLLEGKGTIIVPKTKRSPKGKLNYPSIQIIFDYRDMSLALIIQSTLGHGRVNSRILGYVFIIFLFRGSYFS
jgi:hypothetical protein